MFIVSVKAEKRRMIPLLLCIALVAAMLIASLCFPASRTMMTGTAVRADSNEEIAAYLTTLGYTVSLTGVTVEEVALPDVFDEALSAYNDLQKQAGFDLSGYAGQRVKCRTYPLTDSELGEGAVVRVYLFDSTVIGGDIASADGTAVRPLKAADTACHEFDKDVTTLGTTG